MYTPLRSGMFGYRLWAVGNPLDTGHFREQLESIRGKHQSEAVCGMKNGVRVGYSCYATTSTPRCGLNHQ